MANSEHYYLGSLGKDGFSSFFGELLSKEQKGTLYIIKGSSGNGKSTLLKKVAAEAEKKGFAVDYIHCSADPDSLDGIACPEKGFTIVDGTPPHTLEPEMLWGRHRVVSLYRYLDTDYLATNAAAIAEATEKNKELMRRAARFVSAASSLTYDVYRGAKYAVNTEKLSGSFVRLAKRMFPKSRGRGRVSSRYYTAITPLGMKSFFDSNLKNYRSVYVINDSTLAAGSMGLEILKNCAVAAGYDVDVGYNPLMSGQLIETVAVRELSSIFVLNSFLNHYSSSRAKTINAHRFINEDKIADKRGRITLCKRCTGELIDTAAQIMTEAKLVHDSIEEFYSHSCNFGAQSAELSQLLKQLNI